MPGHDRADVSVIIGEGGSGGAIAIATANKVYMLEHSIYSVISPEGAASILWHDPTRARDAATNMRITAQDLLELKVIEGIIAEPIGGAHRAPEKVIAATGEQIAAGFEELAGRQSRLPRAPARKVPGHRAQPLEQAGIRRKAFPTEGGEVPRWQAKRLPHVTNSPLRSVQPAFLPDRYPGGIRGEQLAGHFPFQVNGLVTRLAA
jgi:hypothetical protein